VANAALMAGSVMSTGGIAAVAIRAVREKIVRGKKGRSKDNFNEIERRNQDGNDERNHNERIGTDQGSAVR
jgi:hypothetical protein